MAGRLQFDNLSINTDIFDENAVVEGLIRDGYEIVFERKIKAGEETQENPTIQVRKTIYLSCHKDIATPSTSDTSQISTFFNTTQLDAITVNLGSIDMTATYGIGDGAGGGGDNRVLIKQSVTYDFADPENKWDIQQLRVADNLNNTSRLSYSLTFASDWADEV